MNVFQDSAIKASYQKRNFSMEGSQKYDIGTGDEMKYNKHFKILFYFIFSLL